MKEQLLGRPAKPAPTAVVKNPSNVEAPVEAAVEAAVEEEVKHAPLKDEDPTSEVTAEEKSFDSQIEVGEDTL